MNAKKNTACSTKYGLLLFIILLGTVFISSCAGNFSNKCRGLVEKGKYDEAIGIYNRELVNDPNNKDIWRDLAFAYYKDGDYPAALEDIDHADQTNPSTHLCRGLIFEAASAYNKAIKSFGEALWYNPNPKTRAMINSHLDALIRSSLQFEINDAVAQEGSLDAMEIPNNTIAVVKFDGTLLPRETAPIAAGIGEFTMVDLAKVGSLRLVERLKVEILLKELEIGSSQAVDPAQAPRFGRLLGSRNVVTGKLVGTGAEKFRLDGALVSTTDASSKLTEPGEAKLVLDDILRVQKAMVFDILEYLGVQPTESDRDSIMAKPTQSLEAFLAYSRGLEFMMLGMYDEALKQFQLALEFDGGFNLASEQLVNAQISFDNQQNGATTPGQLENQFFMDVFHQGTGNGQMLTSLIDPSELLQPGNENLSSPPNKPPLIGGKTSAKVSGNIDGD